MASELTRKNSSSSRRNWAGGYQDPVDVLRQRSIAAEEGDERESLMWAALEKLPTYDRMRKGIIRQTVDGGGALCSEVDIHRLRRQDRKLLLDRIFRVVEEDNERFLKRLRDRTDRVGLELPKIEVRYENISVEAEVYVGSRAHPTLWNATLNIKNKDYICGFLNA
ncbi:unnamed protein product [Musa hybrid cultivar]